jgi:Secretion system C-terminal sorting domain
LARELIADDNGFVKALTKEDVEYLFSWSVYFIFIFYKYTVYGKFYILILITLISCSSSKNSSTPGTNSSSRKQEAKDIDSLLLVHSLPVRISPGDLMFRMDIAALLEDSLKAKKYKCLDQETAQALFKEKLGELMGSNNIERIREIAEKASKDKNYLVKEAEKMPPFMQSLTLLPCTNETANCVRVKRHNFPDARKERIWEFKYSDTEPISHLVSRILTTLTTPNNTKWKNICTRLPGYPVVMLYPNPVRESTTLMISVTKKEKITYCIIDQSGKTLLQNNVSVNEGSNMVLIETNSLAAGVYILSLNGKDIDTKLRFIKQ